MASGDDIAQHSHISGPETCFCIELCMWQVQQAAEGVSSTREWHNNGSALLFRTFSGLIPLSPTNGATSPHEPATLHVKSGDPAMAEEW